MGMYHTNSFNRVGTSVFGDGFLKVWRVGHVDATRVVHLLEHILTRNLKVADVDICPLHE